jgi:tetratricopeptide (TPR) repeat protein
VNLLQHGRPGEAEKELEACLEQSPDHDTAKFLLAQIETPVSSLYPRQNFTVVVRRKTTLSGLAAKYLGDPLAFYGLARYNGIRQPARIVAGQRLRIPNMTAAIGARLAAETPVSPALSPAAPASSEPKGSADAGNDLDLFNNALKGGRFADAARLADAGHISTGKIDPALLANVYLRAANAEKHDDPVPADQHAREAGVLYLNVLKNAETARTAFLLAVSAQPDDTAAQTGLDSANDQLAAEYFQRGLTAFQRQDLDGAISAWDKVLAIKPSDFDAQLNRAQAVQLKTNLDKLRE